MKCKVLIYQEHLDMLTKHLKEVKDQYKSIKQNATALDVFDKDYDDIMDRLHIYEIGLCGKIKKTKQKIEELNKEEA